MIHADRTCGGCIMHPMSSGTWALGAIIVSANTWGPSSWEPGTRVARRCLAARTLAAASGWTLVGSAASAPSSVPCAGTAQLQAASPAALLCRRPASATGCRRPRSCRGAWSGRSALGPPASCPPSPPSSPARPGSGAGASASRAAARGRLSRRSASSPPLFGSPSPGPAAPASSSGRGPLPSEPWNAPPRSEPARSRSRPRWRSAPGSPRTPPPAGRPLWPDG
mmetsp:Transcript_17679/g.55431  ORF Transcript_17679/g.55431 Transcript_17679/m.55431 type:complete len:224 (+) Transcript_17679:93-764(+)